MLLKHEEWNILLKAYLSEIFLANALFNKEIVGYPTLNFIMSIVYTHFRNIYFIPGQKIYYRNPNHIFPYQICCKIKWNCNYNIVLFCFIAYLIVGCSLKSYNIILNTFVVIHAKLEYWMYDLTLLFIFLLWITCFLNT